MSDLFLSAATVVLAAACITGITSVGGPSISLGDGEVISGKIVCADFYVPAGSNVFFDKDLEIAASGDVIVVGSLLALEGSDDLNAPDLTIVCDGCVYVDRHGAIAGSNGVSTVGASEDGHPIKPGHGSSIRITARWTEINGLIRAGSGGDAGPAVDGGRGGDLAINGVDTCYFGIPHSHGPDDPNGQLQGGGGGDGGDGYDYYENGSFVQRFDAGDGGSCGELSIDIRYGERASPDEVTPPPGMNFASAGQGTCVPGLSHATPTANVTGLPGGDGGDGADGTSQNPNGGDGGNGGNGQAAVTQDGWNGGAGGSCCHPPMTGQTGGKGQDTGAAEGGAGGKGGNGGDAHSTGDPPVYQGKGGSGGNGGNGGDATSGKAGNGGNGSEGQPPGAGGNPGMAGAVTPGAAGVAGTRGAGNPPGRPGSAGTAGTPHQGPNGNYGAWGNYCD